MYISVVSLTQEGESIFFRPMLHSDTTDYSYFEPGLGNQNLLVDSKEAGGCVES